MNLGKENPVNRPNSTTNLPCDLDQSLSLSGLRVGWQGLTIWFTSFPNEQHQLPGLPQRLSKQGHEPDMKQQRRRLAWEIVLYSDVVCFLFFVFTFKLQVRFPISKPSSPLENAWKLFISPTGSFDCHRNYSLWGMVDVGGAVMPV